MTKLKEDFLHYIWKYKLFDTSKLCTQQKEPIEIINSGIHNTDAGPDFFNCRIQIGETEWVGNVELHVNSSDWLKHNHQSDKAYDNVILHVVYQHDMEVEDKYGNDIPTIELKNLLDVKLIRNYKCFIKSKGWISCSKQVQSVDQVIIYAWMNRLAIERLERKAKEIQRVLTFNKNDWETTFYQTFFKYLGLKVNAEPFSMLARNTPLKIIEKHKNIGSIEALLYGQAGFLEDELADQYYINLKKEYRFLKSKFSLTPIDKSMWKMLRLRPANFPAIRISQLAHLLSNQPRLFNKIIETEKVNELQELFNLSSSTYWDTHSQFGIKSRGDQVKRIGKGTINNVIINVVVPFTFVYGKTRNDDKMIEKSLFLFENTAPEKNTIINNWVELGVKPVNALQSQSLIELKNNYCSQKKCLNCSIGNHILSQ